MSRRRYITSIHNGGRAQLNLTLAPTETPTLIQNEIFKPYLDRLLTLNLTTTLAIIIAFPLFNLTGSQDGRIRQWMDLIPSDESDGQVGKCGPQVHA